MASLIALARMSTLRFVGLLVSVGALAGALAWCLVLIASLVLEFSPSTRFTIAFATVHGSIYALIAGFALRLWWRKRLERAPEQFEATEFVPPKMTDFPAGTQFMIKEFDVPLAWVPNQGWFNWNKGTPRAYDSSGLKVDNNWHADSFDEWVGIIEASLRD